MIDQFNMPNIRLLKELGYEVDVACNFVKGSTCSDEKVAALKKTLAEMDVQCYQIDFARNVLQIVQNIKAYSQTKKIIKEGKYDLIHSHSPIGGLLSRLAARKHRESGTKVIYTAHGFHFYKGAPLLNWLLFYPIEKIASRWTDVLITINQEDFAFAKEKMKAKEVIYVPGVGIDVQKFSPDILSEKIRLEKRAGLGLKEGEKMLLSVGELIPRKNHIEVIKALALLEDRNWQYFICGKGERKEELERMAEQLGVSEKIHFLGFRTDISELCNCCDLYVFPSLQEGLPVALMEAIASKVPVICSSIRGNVDLVQDSATFDTDNPQELALKIHQYLNKDNSTEVETNYKHLLNFDLNKVGDYMKDLYGGGITH